MASKATFPARMSASRSIWLEKWDRQEPRVSEKFGRMELAKQTVPRHGQAGGNATYGAKRHHGVEVREG
eukprot:9389478-Prorocentrum_lima.AAC.1